MKDEKGTKTLRLKTSILVLKVDNEKQLSHVST